MLRPGAFLSALALTFGFLSGAPANAADEIVFAFNSNQSAPYVLDKESGIELDIVNEAFKRVGLTVKPMFMVYKRMEAALEAGTIDGRGITLKAENEFFYSDNYVHFRDYAFTRKDSNISLKQVSDIFKYRTGAWQTMPENLGGEALTHYSADPNKYAAKNLIVNTSDYARIRMLIAKRLDVNVEDIAIFRYNLNQINASEIVMQFEDFVIHDLWPRYNHFQAAFRDEKHRDLFDEGLKSLKDDGTYDEIYEKYMAFVR